MGIFISLEGPEGCGKTSQIPPLVDVLESRGYRVLTTREPGGTFIGDQIRATLTRLENTAMDPRTETLLFQASRAQLVEQVIRPHLSNKGIVISDRYADSTLAYQGYGHQMDLGLLRSIINFATGGLKPALTLLLDVDPQIGLTRRANGGSWNRLDGYELEFHQRVREGYLLLTQEEPARWKIIDASRPFDVVGAEILKIVLSHIACC